MTETTRDLAARRSVFSGFGIRTALLSRSFSLEGSRFHVPAGEVALRRCLRWPGIVA